MSDAWADHRSSRLRLTRPRMVELNDWHAIHADPRVWEHFPSGRHTSIVETEQALVSAVDGWDSGGLGYWSVRVEPNGPVIGCGGCRPVPDERRWNLYYRFAPESQGNGYATELASEAIAAANAVRPDWPVVAYMLEHNTASWRVAERLDMYRIWTGPDAGNPDPEAVRFVYADRDDETTRHIGRT